MRKHHIGIALSGGVDSTATALLLKKIYRVHGFFMHLAQPDFAQQLLRVQDIAARLGIDLTVIDLREQFSRIVLDYFANSYLSGLTPNPCMVCNPEIKCGLFLQAILDRGMSHMATGHYARIHHDEDGYHLLCGLDPNKDQSYFLSRLNQKQLSRLVFPLGEKSKAEIYPFVEQHGFTDFAGKESQDVCFLENENVGDYLAQRFPDKVMPGPIVTTQGVQVGEHSGLYRFTIGQRRGLGIPDATPWYVAHIDAKHNRLVVGKSDELLHKVIAVADLHWISGAPPDLHRSYLVKIRSTHRGAQAHIQLQEHGKATLSFDQHQRAVTPGQFVVIYHQGEVLGSGVIQ